MKLRHNPPNDGRAFTIPELLISMTVMMILGTIIYTSLQAGLMLSAKNAAINHSHEDLRSALDRMAHHLQAARNVPTMIDTAGTTVVTGPAAGIKYDLLIGEPYAIDPVMTAGSFTATTTTLSIWRSVAATGAPPIPVVNDVLVIDTPEGMVRSRITAVTTAAAVGSTQKFTLTFAAALGKTMSWGVNQARWARLVRPEAFVVATNGTKRELHYFTNFEPAPSMTDATKFVTLTDQLATGTSDATPFNIVDNSGDKLVSADLRMQASNFNQVLSKREVNAFHTFFRMNVNLSSRLRPKTTN